MKNAITVIDQELIDWFDEYFETSGMSETKLETQTEDLFQMAKDLKEINAELTKREQKQVFIIKSLLMAIEKHEFCAAVESTSAFELAHEYIDSLKGDSDE